MANPKPSNPMKPGETRNPNGRPPKGYSITEMMKKMLSEKPEIKQAIGQQIAKKALQGDQAAMRMLWNYMDGMPQQHTDITSGGKPIPLLGGQTNAENNSDREDTKAK
jgi:hypothetical protein